MPEWTTACPDWESRIRGGRSLVPCDAIFPEQGEIGLRTFCALRAVDIPHPDALVDEDGRPIPPTVGEVSRDWILDIVRAVHGAYDVETGERLIREVLIKVPKKNWKALALDTPIPVPGGWRTMGDLSEGDQVIGTDGRPCNIVGVSEVRIDGECYEVEFSNGEKIVADAGHQWVTYSLRDERRAARTTEEIARTISTRSDGARNHSISMHRSRSVQIVSARILPSVPVKCIAVDAPDHQFLCGRSMIPTHNSGLAASLMLSLMILNWRTSNEAGIIAPSKDTADNVFRPMRDSIKADPELDALFHIQPNMRTITHRVTGMSVRVYASDTETVSGKKWAFVIFEELWLLAQRAGASDIFLEATGGQASRPEGVVISITTESDSDPMGVYKEKLEFARTVRDGKVSAPHFLPVLYEWPKQMLKEKAYLNPENFALVNPNYGASVDPDDLNRKYQEAVAAGGESLRVFLAKRLNVPPSEVVGGSWAGAEFWAQNGDPSLTLEELLRRSEVVTIGIDGGGLDDFLGLAVTGREKKTGRWLHWGRAWGHKIVLERRKSEAERFLQFEREGDLTFVDKPGDDVKQVVDIVKRCDKSGLLAQIGVDRAGITAIVDAIVEALKLPEENTRVVAIAQGWGLMASIQAVERRLAEGAFVHQGSSMMAWCVGNARNEVKGNAIYITKQVSGRAKIDPLMALFDSITLLPNARPKNYKIYSVR